MPEACASSLGAFVPCGCRREPAYRWLCVHTEHAAEVLANQQLRMLGLCTWLPAHLSSARIRPLFPRYLFVQVDLGADLWRRIYRSPGVDTILGTQLEQPSSVSTDALAPLWAKCAPNGVIYPAALTVPDRAAVIPPGAQVRLGSGAFENLTGICKWSNARRVRLLMEIMGRAVPVTVDRDQVAEVL